MRCSRGHYWFGRGITLERAREITRRKSIWMKLYLEARTEMNRPGGRRDNLLGLYRRNHLRLRKGRER